MLDVWFVDEVRVHDILIERIAAQRRQQREVGGASVLLPTGVGRIRFATDLVRRLESDSWQPQNCLIVAEKDLLAKIYAFQARRYNLPEHVVCHRLSNDGRRKPYHKCSFTTHKGFKEYDLTPHKVIVVLTTDAEMLKYRSVQEHLQSLALSHFVVVVSEVRAPTAIRKTLDYQLSAWQFL